MATAYRWSEEFPQGLKPRGGDAVTSRLKPRPTKQELTAVKREAREIPHRDDSTGAHTSRSADCVRNVGVESFRHDGVGRLGSVREDESGASAEKRKAGPSRVLRIPRSAGGKRPAMVEFYTVKRIDNSRLVRHVEPVKLRNLYKTAVLGGIIALFFMFYIYQHFRCIDLSFQLEDLRAKQEQAQSLNSELKLEIETLRDPRRIDAIAQKELGLKRPESTQVREYANIAGAEVAAVQYLRPNHAP